MSIDNRIFFFLNRFANASAAGDRIITLFGEWTAVGLMGGFVAAIFFIPSIAQDPVTAIASAILAGLVARFIFGTPLRRLVRRTRPHKRHEVESIFTEESFSFPSGHSLFFFAFSTIVYCYSPALGAVFLGATLVMTTFRVIAGVHYLSDILAGMTLGILSGELTFHYLTPLLHRLLA